MSRENNKNIAEDTLKSIKHGYYMNRLNKKVSFSEFQEYAEKYTKVYNPKETDELIKEEIIKEPQRITKFKVVNDTTLNTVRNLVDNGNKNIMCLNFASAKNPGGGFLKGSQAQEESLARACGLFPCLCKGDEYYKRNGNSKSCFYTDYMIYSPNVPVFKNEQGKYLDEVLTVTIITSPAVNTNVVRIREPQKIDDIEVVMKRRIEKILSISYVNHHKNLSSFV